MQALFNQAPDYECAIRAGKDARHLWFALRDWRGDDPKEYFGDLGAWAENRKLRDVMNCVRVVTASPNHLLISVILAHPDSTFVSFLILQLARSTRAIDDLKAAVALYY